MKKLLTVLFALAMLLTSAAAETAGMAPGAYRYTEQAEILPEYIGDYWYILLQDGTAEIVRYTGSESELTIPEKLDTVPVTSIGYEAFRNCDLLTSVTIPEGVTSIAARAFYDCNGLTSINLPLGVTSVETSTFLNCSVLTDVIIPQGVLSIGRHAFSSCESLASVTIPDGVTSIGLSAFSGCSSLISVVIPDSVTSIESIAFGSCSSLTSVVIPDSVTEMGVSVFRRCPQIVLTVTPFSAAEEYAKTWLIPYVYAASETGWLCTECQNYSDGSVCSDCGAARPAQP